MLLSPKSLAQRPPSLGISFAASESATIAFPTIWTVVSFPSSNVPKLVMNDLKSLANAGKYEPKVAMLLSPKSLAQRPPSLGISFAASAKEVIIFPAQSTAVIAASSNVPRLVTKSFKSVPSCGSCAPKFSNDDPPVNHDVRPSITSEAVRIRMASASVLKPETKFSSRRDAPDINGSAFIMKSDKLSPSSPKDDTLGSNVVILAITSAAVNAIIAPERNPIPERTDPSMFLHPSMKG